MIQLLQMGTRFLEVSQWYAQEIGIQMQWIREWLSDWCSSLECILTALGNYRTMKYLIIKYYFRIWFILHVSAFLAQLLKYQPLWSNFSRSHFLVIVFISLLFFVIHFRYFASEAIRKLGHRATPEPASDDAEKSTCYVAPLLGLCDILENNTQWLTLMSLMIYAFDHVVPRLTRRPPFSSCAQS